MGKITLTMMKMIMIRRESRRRAVEGEGWNLLSSVSFNDCSCAVLWNANISTTFSRHSLSRCYRHHHRPDATRKYFPVNKVIECHDMCIRLLGISCMRWRGPTMLVGKAFHALSLDGASLVERRHEHVFNFSMEKQQKNFNSRKMMMIFWMLLLRSSLRALQSFQFLFCALSIQCRMANVAAWIKQIVYTLITTHSPGTLNKQQKKNDSSNKVLKFVTR